MLSEAGFSVLVLEANDYVGGRAKTINTDGVSGVPTDLGCEWLYAGHGMESFLTDSGLIDAAIENDALDTLTFKDTLYYSQTISEDGSAQVEHLKDADKLISKVWGDFLTFKKNLLKALGDVSYEGEYNNGVYFILVIIIRSLDIIQYCFLVALHSQRHSISSCKKQISLTTRKSSTCT